MSGDAIIGPSFKCTSPSFKYPHKCAANAASTFGFSSTPSSIIGRAPPSLSSAGWNTSFTLPCKLSFSSLSIIAAPKSPATWPSWPQACIIPSIFDLYSTSACSCIFNASISALRSTVFPGYLPSINPTTPVLATFFWTFIPSFSSSSIIIFDVVNSLKPSSGYMCIVSLKLIICCKYFSPSLLTSLIFHPHSKFI